MKKLVFFIVLLSISKAFAQQDPQYSVPYINQMVFNPASMGARHCIGVSMQGRFQYVGMQDAPIGWHLGLDVPFYLGKKRLNSIGFGVVGYGDYVGYSVNGGLRFAVNYRRVKLGPGDLSIGIDMGLATRRFVNAVWVTPGPPEPGLPDPNAAGETFDMGIGVFYSGDNFYAGISTTHLNGGRIEPVKYTFAQNLYVNGGGFIGLGANKNWRLNPHGIVRTDFATMNFDVGLNALCFIRENHAIIFGSTYRYIDAVGFNIGYGFQFTKGNFGKKGMFAIIYNVDLVTSHLSSFGATSHEVGIRFCFPAKDVQFQRVFY